MDDKTRLAEEFRQKILTPKEADHYRSYHKEEEKFESGVSSILDKVHKQVLERMGVTQKTSSGIKRNPNNNPRTKEGKIKNIITLDRNVRENIKELILSLLDFGDSKITKEILTDHIAFLVGILSEIEKNNSPYSNLR